jgi:predicted ester cyclase
MGNISLVNRFIKTIEDGAINESFLSDDLKVEGIKPLPMGKSQYVEYLEMLKKSFPDLTFNCKEIKQDGPCTIIAKVKLSGTNSAPFNIPDVPLHPQTGKKFVLPVETEEYVVERNSISRIKVNSSRTGAIIERLGINPY